MKYNIFCLYCLSKLRFAACPVNKKIMQLNTETDMTPNNNYCLILNDIIILILCTDPLPVLLRLQLKYVALPSFLCFDTT
jgi:hypothetical protein